jgi:hypothetical protein
LALRIAASALGADGVAFVEDDESVSVEQARGGVAVGQGLQHDQVDGVATAVPTPAEGPHMPVLDT